MRTHIPEREGLRFSSSDLRSEKKNIKKNYEDTYLREKACVCRTLICGVNPASLLALSPIFFRSKKKVGTKKNYRTRTRTCGENPASLLALSPIFLL